MTLKKQYQLELCMAKGAAIVGNHIEWSIWKARAEETLQAITLCEVVEKAEEKP